MDVHGYKEIIETSFPGLRVETCRLHVNGWDSVALEVNGALIFRFPRPNRPDVEAQLEKERALLPELAKALPLPIPQFEYVGDGPSGSGRRFVGYRKIDGVELRASDLATAQAERIAQQLGEFLSCLHRFPVEQAVRLGLRDVSADDWRRHYQELYKRVRERVFPLLGEPAQARAAALWEGFLTADAHFGFRPVLIHRDLNSDHILYDPGRGTLVGIIDWGDVSIGDPAMDFADLFASYGRNFVEMVLARYEPERDATFWERVSFYASVMPFYEVLFGLEEGDEAHIRHGMKGIEQIGG
jgi:aminoglycoside 2''-phosphotransferase